MSSSNDSKPTAELNYTMCPTNAVPNNVIYVIALNLLYVIEYLDYLIQIEAKLQTY